MSLFLHSTIGMFAGSILVACWLDSQLLVAEPTTKNHLDASENTAFLHLWPYYSHLSPGISLRNNWTGRFPILALWITMVSTVLTVKFWARPPQSRLHQAPRPHWPMPPAAFAAAASRVPVAAPQALRHGGRQTRPAMTLGRCFLKVTFSRFRPVHLGIHQHKWSKMIQNDPRLAYLAPAAEMAI